MFETLVQVFQGWRATRETAEELSHLSDRQLRDIGVHRSQIDEIASKVGRNGRPVFRRQVNA